MSDKKLFVLPDGSTPIFKYCSSLSVSLPQSMAALMLMGGQGVSVLCVSVSVSVYVCVCRGGSMGH